MPNFCRLGNSIPFQKTSESPFRLKSTILFDFDLETPQPILKFYWKLILLKIYDYNDFILNAGTYLFEF